jgi:16S rRNA (guanine966-N2)-methyltransferase
MRIISGKHRGRKLTAPSKLPVRPTTDMAKEALFNILNNDYYLPDLSILDLFSGTGNIAFEFGSRGCNKIIAVDADQGCVKFITATTEKLELSITAIKSDVFSYLAKTTTKHNIIFADPPYDLALEDFEKIPELVFSRDLIEEDGLLIVEHSKHTDLSKLPNFSKQRKYGGSVFSFFEIIS